MNTFKLNCLCIWLNQQKKNPEAIGTSNAIIKRLLLTFFVSILMSISYATTYYVDTVNGSNDNNGTSPSTAWRNVWIISRTSFNPGDQILFKSGQRFTGYMELKAQHSGTYSNRVTIGRYGSGDKPILDGIGYLQTIKISEAQYITIDDVKIENGALTAQGEPAKNARYGINITNADIGQLQYITIRNVDFNNIYTSNSITSRNEQQVQTAAIYSKSFSKGTYEYKNMTIEGCYFTNIGRHVIFLKAMESLTIKNNVIFNVGGAGMALGNCYGVYVHGNSTDQTGSSSDIRMAGRGSGFWIWNSMYATVYHNIFKNARGYLDSYGMHIDHGNRNVVFEYNLSINNEGGFAQILGDNVNCGYRFNISCGDGWRRPTSTAEKGHVFKLSAYGSLGNISRDLFIYNNSVYVWGGNHVNGEKHVGTPRHTPHINFPSNSTSKIKVYNNIVHAKQANYAVEVKLGNASTSSTNSINMFDNNVWFDDSKINSWATFGDGSQGAYRGSGAVTGNPNYNDLNYLEAWAYKIRSGSSAAYNGKKVFLTQSYWGFYNNLWDRDYFGNRISSSSSLNRGAYNGTPIR